MLTCTQNSCTTSRTRELFFAPGGYKRIWEKCTKIYKLYNGKTFKVTKNCLITENGVDTTMGPSRIRTTFYNSPLYLIK